MGKYLKRCESVTMKCRAVEEDMQLIFSKKRKVYSELENESCSDVELAENSVSPAASWVSGSSKLEKSNDVVRKRLRSPNLDSEGFEKENSTSTGRIFSRETTPSNELYGDSEQAHLSSSTSKRKSSPPPTVFCRKFSSYVVENMPSTAELDEFFAAVEKYEQKRFAEQYNYDIVKDVPLEGKYQWVRLLP